MNNYVIETTDLGKKYNSFTALQGVNLKIKKGKIYGLIGPNGAGKTTFMKLLAGLICPSTGNIKINGHTTEEKIAIQRKKMSFMIETPYVKMDHSAWHNLEIQRLQKGITDKQYIKEIMEIVGLKNVGNKTVKHFSLGMRQRLGLANALICRPDIMVLDEPVNGLDPDGMIEIRNLILEFNKKYGITIIISSHILTELSQLCSDYIFIRDGKLIKEVSSEELEHETRNYYSIVTNDHERLKEIIENKLDTTNYKQFPNDEFRLFDLLDEPERVSQTIVQNGLIPIKFNLEKGNLEDYYISIIGG